MEMKYGKPFQFFDIVHYTNQDSENCVIYQIKVKVEFGKFIHARILVNKNAVVLEYFRKNETINSLFIFPMEIDFALLEPKTLEPVDEIINQELKDRNPSKDQLAQQITNLYERVLPFLKFRPVKNNIKT
jgi:hypothetical protein